ACFARAVASENSPSSARDQADQARDRIMYTVPIRSAGGVSRFFAKESRAREYSPRPWYAWPKNKLACSWRVRSSDAAPIATARSPYSRARLCLATAKENEANRADTVPRRR